MQRTLFGLVGLAAFVFLPAYTVAEESVENPEYKKWVVWKEGAYATLKGENSFGAMTSTVTTTQTLKSVAADKIVIEVTSVTETNGQTIKSAPVSLEILARTPKPSE